MKAIIIDTSIGQEKLSHDVFQIGLTTKIANKSLLEHHIDRLVAADITEVIVLTEKLLPASLTSGRRWNIDLEIKPQLSIQDITGHEPFLMITDQSLTNLDIKIYIDKAKDMDDPIIAARPISSSAAQNRSNLFPLIINADYIRNENVFFTGSPARLGLLLLEFSYRAKGIDLMFNIFSLKDHGDYWMTSRIMLDRKGIPGGLPGFPLSENIWIDVDTRVNPDVSIDGFVLIGKNSKVLPGVSFKGFVIIGDNVVVDKRATISDSIITDNTYVGTDIHIDHSIVNKSSVYKVDKRVGLKVEESFILGQTWPGKRIFANLMNLMNV